MSSGLLKQWASGAVATGGFQASGVQQWVCSGTTDFRARLDFMNPALAALFGATDGQNKTYPELRTVGETDATLASQAYESRNNVRPTRACILQLADGSYVIAAVVK
jgi:hypothetical protein